jgi:competence protein ComEC
MRATFASLLAAGLLIAVPSAQTKPATKTLDIYITDTEGGKATLFVSPTGESVLIDTGNPGQRDLDRILAVLKDANVTQIDHLILTHYHVDHIGGLQELAKQIPIKEFIDHGPSVEPREQVQGFQAAYAELYGKAKHIVAKPGDKIAVAGLNWTIVSSAGKALTTPLPGGGKPNPLCADFKKKEITNDPENGQSVGSVISYGKFRAIDLGDLLWDNEFDLMCPANKIGPVDLYLVSHHGTDPSGSEALVHGLHPRVAIMQNGTRKGGTAQTTKIVNSSPGLEDLWQLHWSYNVGLDNPSALYIANIDEPSVIATVLTAPPPAGRGGPPAGGMPGPGGAPGAGAAPPSGGTPGAAAPPAGGPPTAPPMTPLPGAAPPAAGAPAGQGAPPAGAPGAGAPGAGGPGGRQGGGFGGRGGPGQPHNGPASYIKVSAQLDGTFTVTNTRTGFSKTYQAK